MVGYDQQESELIAQKEKHLTNYNQMKTQILNYTEEDKKYRAELNARLNKETDKF